MFCVIQDLYLSTELYTPGQPSLPHPLPKETTPMEYQRLPFCTIRGPPLSPEHVSFANSPPAQIWFSVSAALAVEYNLVHSVLSNFGTINFILTSLCLAENNRKNLSYLIIHMKLFIHQRLILQYGKKKFECT